MKRKYKIATRLSGWYESVVEAESEDEAIEKFEDELTYSDFGKLKDVGWEEVYETVVLEDKK